jgi:hypothetical protein
MTAAVQQLQSVGRASGRYKSPDSWRQGADFITVLTSKGPLLTKRWTSDGIEPYDRAKHFTAVAYQVSDIRGLSRVLTMLQEQPRQCAIRGRHLAHDDAGTNREGGVETTRDLEHFTEVAHQWVCLDVDEWVMPPGVCLDDPPAAVSEFISQCLPAEFQEITHHWQLSSSAGAPGKEHLLKAHIWFWLDEQRTGPELEAWARGLSLPVDITVFRTVQVHYTAAPVIDPGVSCPIGTRSGLTEGILGDEVSLVMPDVLELPRAERVGRAGMVDPRGKPGLIGAFCRAYPPHRVVTEVLPEVFEYEGDSDVRLTWLQGGGSPGGACITDDELRIYNSHSTDPFEGHAQNMWDLVRHYKFGELDSNIDPGAVDWSGPAGLPSHKAMTRWVRTLEDVAAGVAAEVDQNSPRGLALSSALAADGQPLEPQAAHRRPSLRVYTIGELVAQPVADYLIKGLLPKRSLAMIYGESGSGKTFVVIDMLCAVALGTSWRGHRVKQAGVIYVAAEAQHSVGVRFKAYARYHGVDLSEAPIGIVPQSINLMGGRVDRDLLVKACNEMSARGFPVGLIVIDTLNRVMGGADENASDAMGTLITQVDAIKEATGATVFIVHHAGKDNSRGARGHSSLRAAVDAEFEVTRTGRVRSIKVTKSRDGADGVTYPVELISIKLGLDEDLDDITSCVADQPTAPVAAQIPRPRGKWQAGVFDAVSRAGDDGVAANDLPRLVVDRIDPGATRGQESVVRARDELIKAGTLVEVEGRVFLPDPLAA